MSSAICFNLDQSNILSSGNGLIHMRIIYNKKLKSQNHTSLFRLTWADSVCRGINPFPNNSLLLRVCSASLLKTLWEKEKLLATSNFSFFLSVFYPFGKLSAIFIELKIVFYKLFQFGRI